jgi:hypothetical protein
MIDRFLIGFGMYSTKRWLPRKGKPMRLYLWKLFLRTARTITLTVDDWIQRQEVSLRARAAVAEFQSEVDPVASALRERSGQATREKAVRRERKPRVYSELRRAARPARLKYQHGEFVRS